MSFLNFFRKGSKLFGQDKDPVCGMKISVSTTPYKSIYEGKVYGFCSQNCKETFDESPQNYKSS